MTDTISFLLPSDAEELQTLSSTVYKFAAKELAVRSSEEISFRRTDFEKMAQLGLAGVSVPEDFGGTALSPLAISAILFEIAKVQLGPAVYLSVHHMVSRILAQYWKSGKSEIESLASGALLGAFCLTEAQAGSDAAALATRAEKTANGYILNGEKIYITSAGVADLYLVFARTGGADRSGISAFVVMKTDPGISFSPFEKKMGAAGSPIATVTFTNCEVPAERLVGTLGEGYKIALSGLAGGRISIASCACGIAADAFQRAIDFSKERKQFGKPIVDFQGIQFMLAEMWMRTRASILMTREAALFLEAAAQTTVLHASAAKCLATDSAMQTTTDAVQVFGGAGYLQDYHVERLMRDAKMLQIVEGTNQIQRMVIARELLRS